MLEKKKDWAISSEESEMINVQRLTCYMVIAKWEDKPPRTHSSEVQPRDGASDETPFKNGAFKVGLNGNGELSIRKKI